ncbi:MAG: 2-C-methyl-D-erythritol 4-phosphate cytidylyltransferase [Actinobacteria bacterium]|nr:MAG: 2-C-methyl-D-erythritol 4-phosphate cytidylyltransferase [Actinomycetota bacterium]
MNIAIVLAAGAGQRMKQFGAKQFINLADKPLLSYSLDAFEKANLVDAVILVVKAEQVQKAEELVRQNEYTKVAKVLAGGKERQDSCYQAVKVLNDAADIVAIHDAARALIGPKLIDELIAAIGSDDGIIAGVPVIDTIKRVTGNQLIKKTAERAFLWVAQTPQVFKAGPLKISYEKAMQQGYYATDDASLLERQGYRVKMYMGSYDNIKITTPEDLNVAEEILKRRKVESRNRL